MPVLTQGDLRVLSAIPIADITDFYMKIHKNSHGFFRLEGIVPEEEGEESLLQPLAWTEAAVYAGNQILFAGLLKEVQVMQEGRGYRISLTGVSSTERLDCRKKSRSFQDSSMTYREAAERVLADTEGMRVWFHGEDRKIGKPVYQIEETDWEFLVRLACMQETAVVPFVYAASAGIGIGLPEGQRRTAETGAEEEQVWSDRRRTGVCRRIRTGENWDIGDRIEMEKREYVIIAKECQLEKGLLVFRYILSGPAAFRTEPLTVPYGEGILLPAVVLDTEGERVRVKFDMDREQDEESAYWYPWRPDMGNLMYCMPEKGERVYIHAGEIGRAICGIHKNGSGNAEMNPACRYFNTEAGKSMYLTPGAVGFLDRKQEKPLQMELEDGTGASVMSHKGLVIYAKETVGLKGKRVLFDAPQEISLVKKAAAPTVINMCNGFDSIGAANRVTMAGAGGDDFPLFGEAGMQEDRGRGREEERKKTEQEIIGSTPVPNLEESFMRRLEGCQVKRLGGSGTGSSGDRKTTEGGVWHG